MNAPTAQSVVAVTRFSDHSDEELAYLAINGSDNDPLQELILRYSPRLRRLLYTLVGSDPQTIMDAEQEVFVMLLRKLPQFRGDARFSTFFYSLARNRTLDLLRSRSRRQRRSLEFTHPDAMPSPIKDTERQVIDQERVSMLRDAMKRLRPGERMMLYLRDAEDVGIAELASMTGLKSGTVKSRLSRTRARLATILEEMGYEHEQ